MDLIVTKFNFGNKTKAAASIGMKRARFHNYLNNGRPLKDSQILAIRNTYVDKISDKDMLDLIQKSVKERSKK